MAEQLTVSDDDDIFALLQGAVSHEDFEGHRGTIKAGDVQWMTAGRGIVHSEMPAAPGTSRGLQLWVNLSSQNKM